MTASAELLPCPFCGGSSQLFSHANQGDYVGWLQHKTDYWVCCTGLPDDDGGCGGGTCMHEDSTQAVAAWNRRSTPTGEAGMREALERLSAIEQERDALRQERDILREALTKATDRIRAALLHEGQV